jgi:hypothetical protein
VARLRRRKAEDYYEEAMRLLQAQYYAAALEATDKAIGIEPGHAQAHQLRSNKADPAARKLVSHLYDLLSDPPMPGIDQLRAIALRP